MTYARQATNDSLTRSIFRHLIPFLTLSGSLPIVALLLNDGEPSGGWNAPVVDSARVCDDSHRRRLCICPVRWRPRWNGAAGRRPQRATSGEAGRSGGGGARAAERKSGVATAAGLAAAARKDPAV